jgi:glycosyltransferase involved in cell wall biosynthesis
MFLSEALVAGKPLVVTRTGVAPDIIEDGKNGSLTDPGDTKALQRRSLGY